MIQINFVSLLDNPCELDDHISIEVNEVRRPEMERDNRVQDDYDLTLPYYNRILPGDCADDELYDPSMYTSYSFTSI